ncbi:MAG: protein kinase [Akkermansiaceae bacterium]
MDKTLPSDEPSDNDATLPMTLGYETKTISDFLTEKGIDAQSVDLESSGMQIVGKEAERYSIAGELARGGMGAVLNAKDMNLRRDVAMKIVLDPLTAQDSQIARFVHEAQVTGQLEHPNIVPVHELGVDAEDKVYYTMKYIRGTNLGDILTGLPANDAETLELYPLPRLLNIFTKACDALAFAHSRGVIHRDLKPDNIMIGDYGEVLIVDWGLAKVLGEDETKPTDGAAVESIQNNFGGDGSMTMDGSVMGTPAYMPPEQAEGDINSLGPAADVYSMGAILYAMLTLKAPVEGKTLDELLQKVRSGNIKAPETNKDPHPHCPDGKIPASLSSVAMKAMALDREDRYESVQTLQADVQAYLDGFATSAEDAGLWRLIKLFIARNRAMVIAAVAAWAIITAVIAVAFVINIKERRAALEARSEAVDALQAFKDEQEKGLRDRRTAAPAMVKAANTLIINKNLEGAALQVDLAREYDPTLASAHLLAAQLMIIDEDYEEAINALGAYLQLVPDDDAAKQLTELCGQVDSKTENESNIAFAEVFSVQKAWQLADQLNIDRDQAFKLYKKRLEQTWPHKNITIALEQRPDGLLKFKFMHSDSDITDLSPLKGMPIGELHVHQLKDLTDLSPLRGMPLRILRMSGTNVSELAPLTGAPLTALYAKGTKISNLSPLTGMPLKNLDLSETQISDLSPLKGMPLEHLVLTSCQGITDLSPLKGMPITRLSLGGCKKVTDISALTGMPLKSLDLESTGKLKNLSPLTSCKSLEILNLHLNASKDLSPLRGLPLKSLLLSKQATIAPLAGMPLESLMLTGCNALRDLSPLKGMPLRELEIVYSAHNLRDISPLEGLPLRVFKLTAHNLEDLSPIAKIKSLEYLALVKNVNVSQIDFLDKLPNLRTMKIFDRFEGTPEEFRKYQAKQLREKTEKAE